MSANAPLNFNVDLPGTAWQLLKKNQALKPVDCADPYNSKDEVCKPDSAIGRKVYLVPWIALYIGAIYETAMVIGGILATVMIMIGGFIWLTSAGSTSRVSQGKEFIGGAFVGLALLLGSYVLLNTVSPSLVTLQPIKVVVPEPPPPDKATEEVQSCETIDKKMVNIKPQGMQVTCGYFGDLTLTETGEKAKYNLPFDPQCMYTYCVSGICVGSPSYGFGTCIDCDGITTNEEKCEYFSLFKGNQDYEFICRGGLCQSQCYIHAQTSKCMPKQERVTP